MRRAWTLFVFVLAVFVAGALLSPWIYWAVQSLAQKVPQLRSLADHSFPRFVSRTLLILTILGLWPLLRIVRKRSWRELGFVPATAWGTGIARGLALGFATLGVFLFTAFALGVRTWRGEFDPARLAGAAALALVAAAIVAPLEELIFRGVLFGALRRPAPPQAPDLADGEDGPAHRWFFAVVISSVVFALVHFINTPRGSGPVTWNSGFQVLAAMFGRVTSATGPAQFVNLSICGVLLAWAFQRTGTIYFSIGLHAGWIFWMKLGNALTVTTGAPQQLLWGTRRVIDGWAATVLLLGAAAVFPLLVRKNESSASDVARASHQTQTVG